MRTVPKSTNDTLLRHMADANIGVKSIIFTPCNVYKYVYNYDMLFTWDEKKRQSNLKKHGVDFTCAASVFAGPTFTWEDRRFDYGEQRWITMGLWGSQVVVLVVHTETEEEIHVISIRKADKDEQALFFNNI